jgi:hypothetical protein
MVDGDGTYPPVSVHTLISPILHHEADMVVGSRLHDRSQSQFKTLNRLGNKLLRWILITVFRVKLTDVLSGYRAFNRKFVEGIPLFGGGFEIEVELTIKALQRGFQILEIPVDLGQRTWAPKGQTPYLYHLYKHDRLSTISALTVSPKRRRLALYLRVRARNLTGLDVRSFLRHLLQHLRGPVALLWDRGPIHRRREVQVFLRDRPRVQGDYFPAYAPELNPAALSNTAPQDLVDLKARLRSSIRRTRSSQQLLWACIYASDLPWPR